MKIGTVASALTTPHFETWTLNQTYTVEKGTPASVRDKDGRVKHNIKFSPPLGSDEASIACRRYLPGVIYTSNEDQAYCGVEIKNTEEVARTIRFKCDLLIMTVRFVGEQRHFPSVFPIVSQTSELQHFPFESKEEIDYVRISRWPPEANRSEEMHALLAASPEVTLTVARPLGGLKYSLTWRLPVLEPIEDDERQRLTDFRQRMRAVSHAGPLHRSAEDFLRVSIDLVRWEVEPQAPGGWDRDPSIHAGLFALNDSGNELTCVACSDPRGELATTVVSGGRDVIGTAHRSGKLMTLNRSAIQAPLPLLERLPSTIQHLIAIPLHCNNLDAYPTAIFVLASTSQVSVLSQLSTTGEVQKEATTHVFTLWLESYKEILELH
jgi:hypothetical protein